PSLFLHGALQRGLMLTCEAGHLGYFRLSHLICVDSTNADALLMDVEHNTSRLLRRLVKEALKDVHDEIHRRVVVVQKQHLVQAPPLRLRPRLCDYMSAGVPAPASVAVPRHRQPLCGVSFVICQDVILIHSSGIMQEAANARARCSITLLYNIVPIAVGKTAKKNPGNNPGSFRSTRWSLAGAV